MKSEFTPRTIDAVEFHCRMEYAVCAVSPRWLVAGCSLSLLALLPASLVAGPGTSASQGTLSTNPGYAASDSEQSSHDTTNPDQSTEESSQQSSEDTSQETSQETSQDTSASSDGNGSSDDNSDPDDENQTSDNTSSQPDDSGSDGSTLAGSLVLASSIGTTLATGIVIGVVIANNSKKSAALEMYLRQNTVAFSSDVSTGGGPIADDLASFFGVSPNNRPEFGRLLRDLYPTLRPIVLRVDDDPEAADRFIRTLIEAMRHSPALERDLAEAGFLKLEIGTRDISAASQG